VLVPAALLVGENSILHRALDSELMDVPALHHRAGQSVGDIADPNRGVSLERLMPC